MSSLFGSISISLRALLAQQAALQTTSENIGNVNNPAYARRRAVMVEDEPIFDGRLVIGNGVHVQAVESLRDRILELRMHEETQQNTELQAFAGAMTQVQVNFSDPTSGIGAQMDAFFASLTRLSTNATDMSLRQNVLTTAENLASTFRTCSQNLHQQQQDIDLGVGQTVDRINVLTSQIADLNGEVTRLEKLGGDASAFEDQRTQLIRTLSGLTDVTVIDADDGLTLTTGNGAPLVVGTNAFTLGTDKGSDGLTHVISNGQDVTTQISGGSLAGLLRARDQGVPNVLSDLDNLAAAFASSVNAVHQNGFDLNGNAGIKLFSGPAALDPAANFAVAISDPSLIAASGSGVAGDNSNLTALVAVQTTAIVKDQNPVDFYSGLVARLGNDISNAQAEQQASELTLGQLQKQRDSISGVSLDEEAANLIRYQRAFEASARVVSVIDEMAQTVINLGKN